MVEKRNLILPIWHRVNVEEVARFSPPLADKKAGTSSEGINSLVRELTGKIKPEESPLIVARNLLFELGVESPPISDEWWLDVIEYKEFLKFPDINSQKRWIFPLPFLQEDRGVSRGHNIASTALQLDWSFEGEELNISPITHPEKVHEFIRRWPGLYECARQNPALLALYVPQLTIVGFDSGFEDVFDNLLVSKKKSDVIFSYGSHDTVDGKPALCNDIIAYRHETFGNYEPDDLGKWYFDAHDGTYIRSHWEVFEGLVWLLSNDSNWLPEKHRQTFITGIKSRDNWIRFNHNDGHHLHLALLKKKRHQFKLTRTLKKELYRMTENAIRNLEINEDAEKITESLLSSDIINCYYDYQDWLNQRRKK